MLRFQLFFDQRQIFAADLNAHTVHCKHFFVENVQNCLFYEGINIVRLKMCNKAIFELIVSMKIIDVPTYIFFNNTQMLLFLTKKYF
jgi:hypothetical protein